MSDFKTFDAWVYFNQPFTNCRLRKDITNKPDNRLSGWKRVTKIRKAFGKGLKRIIFFNFMSEENGNSKMATLKLGLLLNEENLLVRHWVLGRIEEITFRRDGKIKVIKVRTTKVFFF